MVEKTKGPVTLRAIRDHVLVTDMEFGDVKTEAGIIIQSDDGKAHGVHPRWAKVYAIGPEQTEVKIGQWILVEHGRWTRIHKIDDGDSEKNVQRVESDAIMLVSNEPPNPHDIIFGEHI